jgi:hypothetical protein
VRQNKIYIIGFRHSGTTLLMSLINFHPHVDRIYFEKNIINVAPNKEWMKNYLRGRFEKSWGDKVPWYEIDGKTVIERCRKWLDYFRPHSRIIHIVRHPIDVAISNNSGSLFPQELMKVHLNKYTESVPQVIDFINSTKYGINVLFEDLVLNTNETLDNIYQFCNLKSNTKVIESVKSRIIDGIKEWKAFNYKNLTEKIDIPHFPYDEVLKRVGK